MGGTKTELLPLVEFSAELLKGSARVKRSGSSREVSGDFSPSISFSVSEPERKDGERERERKVGGNRWQRQRKGRRGRTLHTNEKEAEDLERKGTQCNVERYNIRLPTCFFRENIFRRM